jgi:MauM/NapG family ferredoxin protein
MMHLRRTIQIISLSIFLALLIGAVYFTTYRLGYDLFLRIDPVVAVVTIISGRALRFSFLPAIIGLLIAPVLGRVFCGYVCPMGTTVHISDKLAGIEKFKAVSSKFHRLKYYLLLFLIGASILGVSLVFVAAPIPLITRFYGLLINPLVSLFGYMGLKVIQPLSGMLFANPPVFKGFLTPRFATQLFILLFFIGVFSASRISRRFWCRYLCPSGAILGLLSVKPLYKRHVTDACISCGKCASTCPMNAIKKETPDATAFRECIVCHKCENVCPVSAVSFSFSSNERVKQPDMLPDRRGFLLAGIAGFGTAAVSLTGLNSLYGKAGVGIVEPPSLLRPPGAISEKNFLSLCVRCGECMIACPTNALQPIWFDAGFTGLFSPSFVARRGACNPDCNNCGSVCPTHAIRNLPVDDRIWAKIGTAMIVRQKCLAWEQNKRCMVCDEVCPYHAVEFTKETGNTVPVPKVLEERCTGCGRCEYHCPVRNQAAIIVTSLGALRQDSGSAKELGESQGLNISIRHKEDMGSKVIEDGTAPGFDAP